MQSHEDIHLLTSAVDAKELKVIAEEAKGSEVSSSTVGLQAFDSSFERSLEGVGEERGGQGRCKCE